MEDLRQIRTAENKHWINFKKFVKKNKWKLLITVLVLFILIFPQISASVAANWINSFVGTLIKTISL